LQLLREEGIHVLLETELTNVTGRSGEHVQLHVQSGAVSYLLGLTSNDCD
jgi:hypothetical protein